MGGGDIYPPPQRGQFNWDRRRWRPVNLLLFRHMLLLRTMYGPRGPGPKRSASAKIDRQVQTGTARLKTPSGTLPAVVVMRPSPLVGGLSAVDSGGW